MDPRRLRPAVVLSVWTLLVWTTRIRNIWTDEELSTAGQVWRTGLALVFTGFAVVTLVVWVRGRQGRGWRGAASLVRVFAAWTIGVWAIRAVQIGMADHDAAFKLVHTLLAVASTGLALWADHAAHAGSDSDQRRSISV